VSVVWGRLRGQTTGSNVQRNGEHHFVPSGHFTYLLEWPLTYLPSSPVTHFSPLPHPFILEDVFLFRFCCLHHKSLYVCLYDSACCPKPCVQPTGLPVRSQPTIDPLSQADVVKLWPSCRSFSFAIQYFPPQLSVFRQINKLLSGIFLILLFLQSSTERKRAVFLMLRAWHDRYPWLSSCLSLFVFNAFKRWSVSLYPFRYIRGFLGVLAVNAPDISHVSPVLTQQGRAAFRSFLFCPRYGAI